MTYLSTLKTKKIVVLGAGVTGYSCARFLQSNNLNFSINDSRENAIDIHEFRQNFPNADISLGRWDQKLIASATLIIVSPGIDLATAEISNNISAGCKVIGDVELYCLSENTPILAVTGSNGKSTVVSLLAHVGSELGKSVTLGGNIGSPVLDILTEKRQKDVECLILELSSFQLESLHSMKAIAGTVLNLSDDHLDRHLSMENYAAIKQKIYSQSKVAIFNRGDKATFCSNHHTQISFGIDAPKEGDFGLISDNGDVYLAYGHSKLINIDKLPLAGLHNALNYLAVLALGKSAGWSLSAMVEAIAGFKGLSHRCQKVETDDNVIWINDSKATNVGATLAAIEGISATLGQDKKLVLIAGGEGKGADFSPLEQPIYEHVGHLITLGKDGDKIAQLARNANRVKTIKEAVNTAKSFVEPGDVVLLSPACASIDMFANFAERGDMFVQALREAS